MEQLDLATPQAYPATTSTVTNWKVDQLLLQWAVAHIQIILLGPTGERYEINYNGAVATSLMVTLNKANLSVKSLHKRILEYLITDGKIAGTITGTVD